MGAASPKEFDEDNIGVRELLRRACVNPCSRCAAPCRLRKPGDAVTEDDEAWAVCSLSTVSPDVPVGLSSSSEDVAVFIVRALPVAFVAAAGAGKAE